ncbi:MAG TPA: hypothetical protein VGO58_01655 [Chitinophagaceae bacterium]|jgi:hypothetical protein|nr:hypothetical protein [Chitinophagaceae bacterium]
MSLFLFILNGFELAACIVGFLYWNKIKGTHWKWFPVYLAAIVLGEIAAEFFLHIKKDLATNGAIYSYFVIPLEFFFFYWLFYRQFKHTKSSKWPLIAAAIYFVCLVADLLYINKIDFFFESFSLVVGSLFFLVLLLIYFRKFMKSEEIVNYRSSMMFWVCLGLMIFYIGSMPFSAFRTFLWEKHNDLFYIYWYAQFILGYLMYSLFIVSFIWGKPK